MYCKILESSNNRKKYVIYPNAESKYFVGYIVAENYDKHWIIELMLIIETEQRKGYGSYLLLYVLNDLKIFTNLVITNPTTQEALNFFQKHNFKSVFHGKDFIYYYTL